MLKTSSSNQKVQSSSHKLILHSFHYEPCIQQLILLKDKNLEVSTLHKKKEQRIPVGRKIFAGKLTTQNMVRKEREFNTGAMGLRPQQD